MEKSGAMGKEIEVRVGCEGLTKRKSVGGWHRSEGRQTGCRRWPVPELFNARVSR